MDALASPAAFREVRLNGFPRALVEVRQRCIGDGGRRVPDVVRTGFSDARFVVHPAQAMLNNRGLARGGSAPSRPPFVVSAKTGAESSSESPMRNLRLETEPPALSRAIGGTRVLR